jgi:hypothetical protein
LIKNSTQPLEKVVQKEGDGLEVAQELAQGMIQDLPDVLKIYEQIQEDYKRSKELASERVEMVDKVRDMVG